MDEHDNYILRTFELAQKGIGTTSPNPLVGAIIVKDGEIISEGFHRKSGHDHAEVAAIKNAQADLQGSTLYCNLEPCCHTNKKTPPCTDLIIEKRIGTVVISNLDPNPEVSGKGIEALKASGVKTIVGISEQEGAKLNEVFFKYIKTRKPFIHLKAAQSLDGKIATSSGDSKWISDKDARTLVHQWRLRYDAVLVGKETLNTDNPKLSIRMGVESHGKIPYRIIVGSLENINYDTHLLSDENTEKTIIVTSTSSFENTPSKIQSLLAMRKVKVIPVQEKGGYLDLTTALECLAKIGITSILVEGGATTHSNFIKQKEFDKISLFIAPKLVGNGPSIYQDQEIKMIKNAIDFENINIQKVNNQILFEAYQKQEGL